MQKISKWVQKYSKYHSKIFAGKYDKIADNQFLPANCRQAPCLIICCTAQYNEFGDLITSAGFPLQSISSVRKFSLSSLKNVLNVNVMKTFCFCMTLCVFFGFFALWSILFFFHCSVHWKDFMYQAPTYSIVIFLRSGNCKQNMRELKLFLWAT